MPRLAPGVPGLTRPPFKAIVITHKRATQTRTLGLSHEHIRVSRKTVMKFKELNVWPDDRFEDNSWAVRHESVLDIRLN